MDGWGGSKMGAFIELTNDIEDKIFVRTKHIYLIHKSNSIINSSRVHLRVNNYNNCVDVKESPEEVLKKIYVAEGY